MGFESPNQYPSEYCNKYANSIIKYDHAQTHLRVSQKAHFPDATSVAIVASLAGLTASVDSAQDELNALVWCDHTDPALIEPFEKADNVK
ncbi:MAG: hypothetical protein ACI8VW_003623 [bacterium]|jgi:hypothetical protein